MRSASAQAVWLTEFLIDTFAQDGLYVEDEARAVELKFTQEMTAGFAHLEGVLGIAKGFVSGEFDSHLDRIVTRIQGIPGIGPGHACFHGLPARGRCAFPLRGDRVRPSTGNLPLR